MTSLPNESVHQWYERAIIANSWAAEELESMHNAPTAYNPAAEQTITRQARVAAAELTAAHAAYIDHRENSPFGPSLRTVVDLLTSSA